MRRKGCNTAASVWRSMRVASALAPCARQAGRTPTACNGPSGMHSPLHRCPAHSPEALLRPRKTARRTWYPQ
eukprot:362539-Chlamydomonas_euryale.AAC.4